MKANNSDYPSPTVAWTTVGILSLTYMFSFMDRQILVLLIDPIKNDLNITDTQVSLLTGLAFASVYTLSGIPMGRAADSWIRKYIVIFGVTIWSTLTILCGFARSFSQLFLARMGVGFGEAALTPTAYSMISDLFPPGRLAQGMSVFALGGTIGAGLSLIFGGVVIGWISEMDPISLPIVGSLQPWQLVLITVGIASLLMVIPLSFITEPKRHDTLLETVKNSSAPLTPSQDTLNKTNVLPFKNVLKYLWHHKAFYGPFITGISLINLFGYGSSAWLPTYFMRIYEWDATSTGMTLGALVIVPTIIGSLLAGWLSDHLSCKGYHGAPLYLLAFAGLLAALLVPLFVYTSVMGLKLSILAVYSVVGSIPAVLSPTIMQMATQNRIRAQISAIYLLVINLIGIGLGPTVIALITDYVFHDEMAVGHSIVITGVITLTPAAAILFSAAGPFKRKLHTLTTNTNPGQRTDRTIISLHRAAKA